MSFLDWSVSRPAVQGVLLHTDSQFSRNRSRDIVESKAALVRVEDRRWNLLLEVVLN